jgi:hypothetical protein
MGRGEESMTTEKMIDYAEVALPYLVHFAKTRRSVTYGQLSGLVGVHWRTATYWLEYIRDEICNSFRSTLRTLGISAADFHRYRCSGKLPEVLLKRVSAGG